MTTFLWIGGAIITAFVILLAWSLCCMAARSDVDR